MLAYIPAPWIRHGYEGNRAVNQDQAGSFGDSGPGNLGTFIITNDAWQGVVMPGGGQPMNKPRLTTWGAPNKQ